LQAFFTDRLTRRWAAALGPLRLRPEDNAGCGADDRVAKVRGSRHALNQTSRATLSLGEHPDQEPASNGK